jgi:Mg-chelatase subunit ChlD
MTAPWFRRLLIASFLGVGLSHPLHAAPSGVCDLYADKTARPSQVLLGEEVEITLTLDGRCPPVATGAGADIILAIDRSASQGDNGTWQPTIRAATTFVDLIDFSRHQLAILTFSGGLPILDPDVVWHQHLTHDGAAVKTALAAIPPPPTYTGATNITAAVEAAQAELTSPRHRADAQPVMVVLTDGQHNAPGTRSPVDAAAQAKQGGTLVVTIGLAVDDAAAQTLRTMASRPDLYFPAPSAADLEGVLRQVAGQVSPGQMTQLTVTDMLPPEVAYVAGSAVPAPTTAQGATLTWTVPVLPSAGWTARYRVRPLVAGTYATNKLAYVDFRDADGSAGNRTFPQPVITARNPVPAPGRLAIYLPIAYRRYCPPSRPFDVVLAMDTSSSMWGDKLTRARDAARELVTLVELPPSKASVLAFNADATVVQSLTTDRSLVLAALDRLPRAEGSRIDLALAAGTAELASARHDPRHAPVIILVTDGRQAGAPAQAALDAAAAARLAGVTVFTIGIGADVDAQLLTAVAGDPDRYYGAPTSADLQRIYRDIAGALPCVGQG